MSLIDKLRSARIGPFAAFDLLGTIYGALLFAEWAETPKWVTVGAFIVGGEVIHAAVGQETPGTALIRNGTSG